MAFKKKKKKKKKGSSGAEDVAAYFSIFMTTKAHLITSGTLKSVTLKNKGKNCEML